MGFHCMISIDRNKGLVNLRPSSCMNNVVLLTIYFACSNFENSLSLKIWRLVSA